VSNAVEPAPEYGAVSVRLQGDAKALWLVAAHRSRSTCNPRSRLSAVIGRVLAGYDETITQQNSVLEVGILWQPAVRLRLSRSDLANSD
jgi:hypothetical protein